MTDQLTSSLVTFGVSVVVARELAPADLGVFAFGVAIIAVLNTIGAFSLGTYVIRAAELHPETLDTAFTLNGVLALMLAAIIVIVGAVEQVAFGNQAVAQVLQLLALVPLFGIVEFRPAAMLQRQMDFRIIAFVNILRVVCSAVVTIGLVFRGESYMSMAYGSVTGAAVGAAAFNVVGRHHAGFRLSFKGGRTMASFGVRMVAIGGVNNLAARLSDIILGNLLGLAALGLYSRASALSSQLFYNIYGAMTRVVFARMSAEVREGRGLRDVFLDGLEVITAIIWPLLIGLAVLARPAFVVIYGERWIDAALPLSLLLIAQFVQTCFGMNWELFVLRDETAKQARFETMRAVVGLIAFTLGSLISIPAAAASRIVEALFGLVLYHPHLNRIAGTSPGELARVYRRSFALTSVAVLPSLVLMISTGWSPRTSLPMIAGAVLIGIVGWLATLIYQRHPLIGESTGVLRRYLTAKQPAGDAGIGR